MDSNSGALAEVAAELTPTTSHHGIERYGIDPCS
jgi:hypothetical protein